MKYLAEIYNPTINDTISGKTNFKYTPADPAATISTYLLNFLTIGFIVGGIIFLFMLIVGSVEWITAGGEKEKAGNASKRITSAVVGIAILFSVFIIVRVVQVVFGVAILNFTIPTIK